MQSLQAMEANNIKIRMAEIKVELLGFKDGFFSKGIDTPLHKRTALEYEFSKLELVRLQNKLTKQHYEMRVKEEKAKILKEKLIALGFSGLLEQCTAEAKLRVPLPINL